MSILTSLAIIFLSALVLGTLFKKIKLPPLIGMLITGIIISPYVLKLISPDLLQISADLRKFALIVILTRAGLSLSINDLKKAGRPAILLCFVPATAEIAGYIIIAPLLLGFSITESALLGCVMAAVSPAVVVPRMLKLQSEGYGTQKAIPQMITAGASCDDVFVIVLFTVFLNAVQTGNINFSILWQIPASILLGISAGILIGLLFNVFFNRFKVRDTVKIIIFISFSFLFIALESFAKNTVPFSGLLAVISLGITFNFKSPERAGRLFIRFEKIWVFAEILLFVLVGAEVNLTYISSYAINAIITIFAALVFRTLGVFLCLIKTSLNLKERLFCAIAYLPKATVQAAIGAIPLSAGLNCGQTILTCAVLAILVTAPLGALLTDIFYKKLLDNRPIAADL